MASGTFDSGWEWFYTNAADPGGPAQHEAKWTGSWSTTVIGGATRLTLNVTVAMRIFGNGAGSSYFESGQAIISKDGRNTGLISNADFQWGFNISARDNVGHNLGASGWLRATHAYGEYEPGSASYTFVYDYTVGGNYRITMSNDMVDSPNHDHQIDVNDAIFAIDVVVPDPDYRPGQRRVSGVWSSHNRPSGVCQRRVAGAWVEMRTQGGDANEQNNPPLIKRSGNWYNQKKIGTGA